MSRLLMARITSRFSRLLIAALSMTVVAACSVARLPEGSSGSDAPPPGGVTPEDYYVYVAAESQDRVDLVRFDGRSAEVVQRVDVSIWPTEIDGPHGLTVSPDGEHFFVTIAHGLPWGRVVKYSTATGEKEGEEFLGLFPATMQISAATGLLYVVNFNLHGTMEPSSVSVVEPNTMTEVGRTLTGVMPHGSRLSPDGRRHYSVAMMDGDLYEIDAVTFAVTRILNTDTGERKMPGHSNHSAGMEMSMPVAGAQSPPKPTWVLPHPFEPYVYVANNGTDEIVEIDLNDWTISRRWEADGAPYNLDVTSDGRLLVASLKKAGMTGVYNLQDGREIARIKNTRRVTHGVVISPDNRYAFISVEGIGGEPGAVDVIDLSSLAVVASADVGMQAGGIAFWKMDR